MTKNIFKKVKLNASPEKLYNTYLSSSGHAAVTGEKVSIQKKVNAPFRAFGGMLSGKILHLVPGKTIVQTWRSKKFHKGDHDSILILNFTKTKGGAEIRLAHLDIPAHDHADVNKGWPHFYWKPWAALLKKSR